MDVFIPFTCYIMASSYVIIYKAQSRAPISIFFLKIEMSFVCIFLLEAQVVCS